MNRRYQAIATGFLANVAILYIVARMPSPNILVKLSAACVVGAVIGFVLGAWFGRPCIRPIAWSAFAALSLLCLPVVLVTYGFALMGAPIVVGYALFVATGARYGARTMEELEIRQDPGQ